MLLTLPYEILVFIVATFLRGGDLAMLSLACKDAHRLTREPTVARSVPRVTNNKLCAAAAADGNLCLLKWLVAHGYEWGANVAFVAAKGNHQPVLQWLDERQCGFLDYRCQGAASGGHLALVTDCVARGAVFARRAHMLAVEGGHLDVLEYASDVAHVPITRDMHIVAARTGNLEVVAWMRRRNPCGRRWLLAAAAGAGNLAILKTLAPTTLTLRSRHALSTACESAAEGGHIDVVQWFAQVHLVEMTRDVSEAAARGGHMHVLRWLASVGALHVEGVQYGAARYGHPEILEWTHTISAERNAHAFTAAVQGAHMDVLRLLHATGYPFDGQACMMTWATSATGTPWSAAVPEWLRSVGCTWETSPLHRPLPVVVASHGNLRALMWLVGSGCPWDPQEGLRVAQANRHFALAAWVQDAAMNTDPPGGSWLETMT